jgi:desumoylating isopeptidase 1
MIEPHYHSLSKTHTNVTFIQVDTHKGYSIAQLHQIAATPTFKTFLKGQLYAEWKGASPPSLDTNLARLIEASRPPLPPSLRGNYSQSPILFSRAPPMEKVVPKLPAGVFPKPLLESISTFLTAKGNIDVLIPPLSAWAKVQRGLDYSVENAWMVLDLLRAGMADRRISGWFAIDGLETLAEIVRTVNSRDEGEWQLRVVAAQLVLPFISSSNVIQISNMFSTPLLTIGNLRPFLPEMIELLTSSVLASGSNSTTKLVKAAASALFNLSRISLEESVTPTEDETISIVVALVESLKTLVEKDTTETKELLRLLVVCLGGFVVLGRDSDTVKEVLGGIEAAEVLRKVDGAVALEVISLMEG